MVFTCELKRQMLVDIKTLFDSNEFQKTRELLVVVPCHSTKALGIDTTKLHGISNSRTQYHHETLYKNDSSKYTSIAGKHRQMKARSLKQQELLITICISKWNRWRIDIDSNRVITFILNKIPRKVFNKEMNTIYEQLEDFLGFVSTNASYSIITSK